MRVATIHRYIVTMLLLLAAMTAWAGGAPHNVLIIVNGRSSESLEIGNAYRRARNIPYRQLLVLDTPLTYSVSYQVYREQIEEPVRAYVKAQGLEEEITCLVLTRGVPQHVSVDKGRAVASLLAAMNLPREDGADAARLANPYYNHPAPFSRRPEALNGMFLVTVLHGYHTADIHRLIAQGSAGDGAAPAGRFLFQTSPHLTRTAAQNAVKVLAQRGFLAEIVKAPPEDGAGIMGYFSGGVFSGLTRTTIAAQSFQPGAVVDIAQFFSAAANNFEETATPVYVSAAWFIADGVSGVHGVVGDAGADAIPATASSQILLDRYTAGYSLAESYFAALRYLNWQNIVFGDPLCTPYGQRPLIAVEVDQTPATGIMPIRVSATSPARGATISRIALYLDDRFLGMAYEPDDTRVIVRVRDHVVIYALPAGTTLRGMLEDLVEAINTEPEFAGPDGVVASLQLQSGTLRLTARTPGLAGNAIPVAVTTDGKHGAGASAVRFRMAGQTLSGGGREPVPARATLSFVGRAVAPGDEVTLQILTERLTYTVPEGQTGMPALLDALVALVEKSRALQGKHGVRAYRDPGGMQYIVLEARTPGDSGNRIPFQLTVKNAPGSRLRAYPDSPAFLDGGHDGSAATLDIDFTLGETVARGTYLLDTATLANGYHRLRVVAYDGSPARVSGTKIVPIQIKHLPDLPEVSLPATLKPSADAVTVPVTAGDGVARVELFLDGKPCGEAEQAPFAIPVALDGVGRGPHDLWAEYVDIRGNRGITPPITLHVLVPPTITAIKPRHAVEAGGITHRITGAGFTPDCAVRLAGVPARSVTYLSPNLLEVVSEAGTMRLGAVEVTNTDGTAAALPNGFEYYAPVVTNIQLSPLQDVLMPGRATAFTTQCFDQFGQPMPDAKLVWETSAGGITPEGVYTAPEEVGQAVVRVRPVGGTRNWRIPITVGDEALRDGQLRHWLVLGPFPDPDHTALETSLIPEATIQPSHGDREGALTWRSLFSIPAFVSLDKTFMPNMGVAAYAHLYLHAPEDTPCALIFGSDDGIRIWLNGEQVYSLRVRRSVDANQTRLPLTLRAGWNRLLVKVDQGAGAWGMAMRLQTPDGKPLTTLRYALDAPPEAAP